MAITSALGEVSQRRGWGREKRRAVAAEVMRQLIEQRKEPAPMSAVAKPAPEHKRAAVQRPCLCCKRPFVSHGPGNRLCQHCRHKPVSPFEP